MDEQGGLVALSKCRSTISCSRHQSIHRRHFDPNRVQLSKLLNIKTGMPEDCGGVIVACSTGLAASKLMDVEKIVAEAPRSGRRRNALLHGRGMAQSKPKTWTRSSKWSAR